MAVAEYEDRIVQISGPLDKSTQELSSILSQHNAEGWYVQQIFIRNATVEGRSFERVYAHQRRRKE